MPTLTLIVVGFSNSDVWKFLERRYQLIHITIAPTNPRPQILGGQSSIHIKRSKADPSKNCEYIRSDYEKNRGSSLKIVPRLCLIANTPGRFRDPFRADELNTHEVVTW
jgi:hypothetical protein